MPASPACAGGAAWAGGILVDTGPLRRHRDFRRLWAGQLVVPGWAASSPSWPSSYQTYRLTGSTAMVGLVSLGQLIPLLAGSLVGGPLVDAWDRRRVMLFTQVMLAVGCAGLAANALLRASAAVAGVRVHRRGRRVPGARLVGAAGFAAPAGAARRTCPRPCPCSRPRSR